MMRLKKNPKPSCARVLLFLFPWLLGSCADGGSFIPPQYPIGPQSSVSGGELQVFAPGGFSPLQSIAGVPGETMTLEARGAPPGHALAWFSSDVSRGDFLRPGELYFRNPGRFEIRVHSGGTKIVIPVEVDTGPAIPETPLPGETPLPETPQPSATPLPPAADLDPFMDEVVDFVPGPFAGFGEEDLPELVLGPPQGGGIYQAGLDVLSLGVGGEIILKSDTPILNGEGADFIVFENPFFVGGNSRSPFAELAEVAVSQDGQAFFAFPCEAENRSELYPGCAGVQPVLANSETNDLDPRDPEVAGGDAFDLEDLGMAWIQYIRISDLSETGAGNSAGFDLDAIAIVHQ